MLSVQRVSVLACLLWSLTACKTTETTSRPKILGGTATDILPQVGILARNGEMHCTATLIAPKRVVTAAHCVQPFHKSQSDRFTFHIGPTLAQSTSFAVVSMQSHPSYDADSANHDIAYADLAEAPPLAPLAVMETTEGLLGQKLHLLGYGRNTSPLEGRDGSSGIKRRGETVIREINPGKMRAEIPGVSSCNGDSGGPAFVEVQGAWKIAGIVSCGDFSCQSYGVYTRASEYRQFLGLRAEHDPKPKLSSCEGVGRRGRCEKQVLFRCSDDCFAAKPERTDCSKAPEGRCVVLKSEQQAVCADASWQTHTIQVMEVKKEGERIVTVPFGGLEIFIDSALVNASTRSLLMTDSLGIAQETLSPGAHLFQAKHYYSSHSTVISQQQRFEAKQSEPNIVLYAGRDPAVIDVDYKTAPDESLYITGESPLLGNWKTAKILTPKVQGWVYKDLLTRGLAYKIVKAKSQAAVIDIKEAQWETGPNHILQRVKMFEGLEERVSPEF